MIDNKKIREIEKEKKQCEVWSRNIEIELQFAKRAKTKEALEWQLSHIKMKLRGCVSRIEWEQDRYNYTSQKDYAKAKEVAGWIGKEIQSAFASDKNTPQILLGVKYNDSEPNYSSAHWSAIVRYWSNERMETKETSINFIYLARRQKK